MSKPFNNPFFDSENMSKMFDMSKFDMSKMFDMSKFEMPKMPNMPSMPSAMNLPHIDMESIMKSQRKNVEAFSALSQSIFESYQSLWRRQSDMIRQSIEEASQVINSLSSQPSPEDKVIRHAEISKANFDKCLANVRDITDTVNKCSSQTLETVSNRVNDSLEDLRGIIKNSRAA